MNLDISHPATLTLLVVSLFLLLIIPLFGWLTLGRSEHPAAAKLWFGGLAINSCASIVIGLPVPFGNALKNSLAYAMILAAIMMMVAAIRFLSGIGGKLSFPLKSLPVIILIVSFLFYNAGFSDASIRAGYLIFTAAFDLWLIFETHRLYRRFRYISVFAIEAALILVCLASAFRAYAYFVDNQSPFLMSLSMAGRLGWITNLLGVLACSFGYWLLALDRAHLRELRSRQEAAAAEARQLESEQGRAKLEELVRQRDDMIMLNSRLTALSGMSIFASTITHETSQYLQALLARVGTAQLLASESDRDLSRELLEIEKLTKSLSESIEPFRNLITRNKYNLLKINIHDELLKLADVFRNEAKRQNFRFDISFDEPSRHITCLCDRSLFYRIMLNITKNAIDEIQEKRISGPDLTGDIKITVRTGFSTEARFIQVSVSDNGRGFPQHMISDFPKLANSSKDDGTGMGIYIARTIIESWNGTMDIRNDQGGVVTFTIPACAPTAVLRSPAPSCSLI